MDRSIRRRREDVSAKDARTVEDAVELNVSLPHAGRRQQSASLERRMCSCFDVKKAGKHIVNTTGPTDVIMKLFGPDRPTAL
jgi:hypothetical protein